MVKEKLDQEDMIKEKLDQERKDQEGIRSGPFPPFGPTTIPEVGLGDSIKGYYCLRGANDPTPQCKKLKRILIHLIDCDIHPGYIGSGVISISPSPNSPNPIFSPPINWKGRLLYTNYYDFARYNDSSPNGMAGLAGPCDATFFDNASHAFIPNMFRWQTCDYNPPPIP